MKTPQRIVIAVLTSLLAFGFSTSALAEVAAEVDDRGVYSRVVIRGNASAKNVKIWTVTASAERNYPLNPYGDVNGDLWPSILEIPHDENLPFVVWSRFNGTDHDLAWSRWSDADGWREIEWVSASSHQPGADLDPVMDLDASDGRAHLVWWRDRDGRGEVYLSLHLVNRWMEPYLVSDPAEDATYPTVDVEEDGSIIVSYDTPNGTRVRTIKFLRPTTITDDLNPLEYLKTVPDSSDTVSEQSEEP